MQILDKPEASSTASINDKTDLTQAEAKALKQYEKIISKGLDTFIEVGNALQEIHDQRLYRTTHDTFKKYCDDKWKMSDRQANRLMLAAAVVENLKSDQLVSSEPIAIPENEVQARVLTGLEPEQQVEVAKSVAKKPGKQTAKKFKEAAQEVSGKTGQDIIDQEEAPRVQSYDPRGNSNQSKKTSATKPDNGDLEKLMELVDEAQTQARKVVGGSDLVKMLGEVADLITRKLNGGAK